MGIVIAAAIPGGLSLLPALCVMALGASPAGYHMATPAIGESVLCYTLLIAAICGLVIIAFLSIAGVAKGIEHINYNYNYMSNEEMSIFAHTMLKLMIQKSSDNETCKKLLATMTITDEGIESILKDQNTHKLMSEAMTAYQEFYKILRKYNRCQEGLQNLKTQSDTAIYTNNFKVLY